MHLEDHANWIYKAVKENLPLALFVLDCDLAVLDCNEKALELLGFKGCRLKGRPLSEIFKEDLWSEDSYLFRVVQEGIPLERVESRVFNRHGEKIPVYIYAYPVKEQGLVVGVILYLADAREIKRYEAQKRRFMSMVAHDFKAPLVIALGFIRRLLEGKAGPLTEKQETYLRTASEELQKLERLILTFLEMLRFETGRVRLELAPCEASRLLQEVTKRFAPEAEKKKIQIEVTLPQEEIWFTADRLQLERVLANLLDNALKYSPPGTKVQLRLAQEDHTVVFEVEDQGPGIPPEDLPHIFEPFYRVSRGAQVAPGTGLGLAIVKNVVEAHGGTVNVKSLPGQGTKFVLRFPRSCRLNTAK